MFVLAVRNILRSRRRTFMTLFLVVSGTFLLSALRFFAYGFQQELISRAVRLDSGLVEVAAFGWVERPTLYRAIEADDAFLESLKSLEPGGTAVSPRIKGGALLNYQERTRFVSVLAVDQEREAGITTLHETVKEGRSPGAMARVGPSGGDSGGNASRSAPGVLVPHEAMVGDRLARALGLSVGSEFYLISSQFDGSLGAIPLKVTGIFHSGLSALDAARVVIPLDAGQTLFGTQVAGKTYYTSIAIGSEDFLRAAAIQEKLQKRFGDVRDPEGLSPAVSAVFDPVVLDWRDLNPGVVELTAMAAKKMDVFLLFFVISISFGILNTVQMSIQERMREFGILLAIGTGPGRLTLTLVWEVFLLIVPGVLLGIGLSAIVSAYFHAHPVDLTGTMLGNLYTDMGFPAQYRPIVDAVEFVKIALSLILPAFAVGLFATGRVRKLNPIEVIQTM